MIVRCQNTNHEENIHKIYIGSTRSFKTRYGSQKFSFDHVKKETPTPAFIMRNIGWIETLQWG